jgi:hypothetical protein
VAKASNVAPKAGDVTFEQAAAVPMAGLVAIQDLRDHGKVRPGQRQRRSVSLGCGVWQDRCRATLTDAAAGRFAG